METNNSPPLLSRLIRFVLTGGLTTALAYSIFVYLIARMHYAPAAFFTWLPTTTVGFLLNRRFTFNLRGKSDRHRQFLLYLSGSVLQMFISIVGYTVLFDVLNSPVTLAFFVNLIVTTAFSFAFMNRITFRLQNV